jgi:CubicO group peptidase (beta-lactamase class C family)
MSTRILIVALVLAGLTPSAATGTNSGTGTEPRDVPLPPHPPGLAWPTRDWPTAEPGPGVDRAALAAALERTFSSKSPEGAPNARALLVVQHGSVVLERYAPGFDATSRFHSWSMAKSITQALVAILVQQGRLDVSAPAPVPLWQSDERRALTLDQLLHMTSGLANDDDRGGSGGASMVADLIFGRGAADQAAFASSVPLVHDPDEHWAYSTATSTIVADIVQREVGGTRDAMLAFMHTELLGPLGMSGAIPEFDASGTFMGGGFFWASARDWARFGYLYLRDGIWDGKRILPEGWVRYTRTLAPAPNNWTYSAHFWINGEPQGDQFTLLPGAPESVFCASGAYGQWVCMVPTHDLLLVRLGESRDLGWDEMKGALVDVIAAFPPQSATEASR